MLIVVAVSPIALAQKKDKLPRAVQMDAGVSVERSPKTGELILRSEDANDGASRISPSSSVAIRVRANLVEVNCNVFASDGTAVRGLTQENFRIYEDGVKKDVTHFDASSQGASIALVLDASPSVLPDSAAMKAAAQELIAGLSPADEVAVVDFSEHTFLLLPFSRNRGLLEKAVAGVDVRKLLGDLGGSNIYRSVFLAARELFRDRTGRKAIILLTDGQDNGLGLNLEGRGVRPQPGDPPAKMTFEDVVRALASQAIEVYAISTENRPRVMTPEWLVAHERQSLNTPAALALKIPAYTVFLAELVRVAGGQLYFLNETGSIAGAYRQIVRNLSAQYTLGYYPAPDEPPGWHSLRVIVEGPGTVRVSHRLAYYAPAQSQ
ncbi:MAG TPA: VWA domain-containing protein [Candidatus Acidoferrales bacterium]|nr:VWA domain-containing protein [Candidatus Acidoferrales bacterium]